MDKLKMSGTDMEYSQNIIQQIEGIEEPNDDSVTISSLENSQMTYSKSGGHTMKTNIMDQQNKRSSYMYERDISPPHNNGDKTLTYKSINSSPQHDYDQEEEQKGLNSPAFREDSDSFENQDQDNTLDLGNSQYQNHYDIKRFGNGTDDFDQNYQDLGGDSFQDSIPNNIREKIPLTQTTLNNKDIISSQYDLESSYLGEGDSEYGESEEEYSNTEKELGGS